jgi:hypothetical protein
MKNARPTGALAGLIALVALAATQLGVEIPATVATALIVVPAGVVSYFWPRWAKDRGVFYRHPAALSGAAAALVVWGAGLAGHEVSTDTAIAIVGGLTALVSIATPRQDPVD